MNGTVLSSVSYQTVVSESPFFVGGIKVQQLNAQGGHNAGMISKNDQKYMFPLLPGYSVVAQKVKGGKEKIFVLKQEGEKKTYLTLENYIHIFATKNNVSSPLMKDLFWKEVFQNNFTLSFRMPNFVQDIITLIQNNIKDFGSTAEAQQVELRSKFRLLINENISDRK